MYNFPYLPVSFDPDSTYHDSVGDKAKFLKVVCRYNTTNKNNKANDYQVHVNKFDHRTPEDVLLLYNKVSEVIKQKLCEDIQAKFAITESFLEDQGQCIFIQKETAVTDKYLVGDMQVPTGVTEVSCIMTIS